LQQDPLAVFLQNIVTHRRHAEFHFQTLKSRLPFHLKFYSLLQKSPVFISVLIIANFFWNIFKRIVPDEYYLFSSNGNAFAAVWSLLWQQTT